jgi:hypothetical protein
MADPTGAAQAGPAQAPVAPAQPAAPQARRQITVRVTFPDLRNGRIADIVQAAPRASIPRQYKWPHVEGMPAATYGTHVGEVIRANYAQVLTHAGATPSDADRRRARDEAIILGSIRAGAAASLGLQAPDFNPSEVVGTGSRWDGAQVVAGQGNATATANYTVAGTMEELTLQEVDVVNTLLYLGMAVPVMQGISLAISGHHFLPTTANTFRGMKRQALQAGGADVGAWIDGHGDSFDDLAFHKACHPILPSLKRGWAKSEEMASRLAASGHGAAAIRLPALPSDAQAGKAAIAVFVKAAPVIRGMGHTISWPQASTHVRAVERAPEGKEEHEAVAALRSWYAANLTSVAFCAGIVQYIRDSTGATQESTLRAFSIRKAVADCASDVNKGVTYARAYFQRVRDQAESGAFPDPAIMA